MGGMNRFAHVEIFEFPEDAEIVIFRYGNAEMREYNVSLKSLERLRRVLVNNNFTKLPYEHFNFYHWQPSVDRLPTMDELNVCFVERGDDEG